MEDNTIETETTSLTTSESDSSNEKPLPPLPQLENEIKDYLNQMNQNYIDIANNTIEIGKRLILAKSLVKHGQWQSWLQNNFQLSYPTATKFMKCAERFPNVASMQHLNSTQMIQLLALPSIEETEKFIEQKEVAGTPVSDMSVKTLRNEIKQWKSKTEKISSAQSSESENIVTIDITPANSQQNQNITEQTISNEPDDTTLDNSESTEQQSYSESQQPSPEFQQTTDESAHKFNEQEPFIPESPAEVPGTYLIEELSSMTNSLIQHENRNEILQNFAKSNPVQLATTIQNLTAIISELKALSQKE